MKEMHFYVNNKFDLDLFSSDEKMQHIYKLARFISDSGPALSSIYFAIFLILSLTRSMIFLPYLIFYLIDNLPHNWNLFSSYLMIVSFWPNILQSASHLIQASPFCLMNSHAQWPMSLAVMPNWNPRSMTASFPTSMSLTALSPNLEKTLLRELWCTPTEARSLRMSSTARVLFPSGISAVSGMDLSKVARFQNLIPSFPWIAPGWRAWGRNPRKGRDRILQRSVAEP